ncbi:MAG: hypothetical protein VKK04_24630 [Synechococcales bacterium]|nr:hypothetical protein [Synechococcales bacterium]
MSGLNVTSGGWSSRYQPWQSSSLSSRILSPGPRSQAQVSAPLPSSLPPFLTCGAEPPSSTPGAAPSSTGFPGQSTNHPTAEVEMLMTQLADAQARQTQQDYRIYQLEQALEQALIYLDELRQQVRHQHDLETQLAITEEYAYVQQQAIACLKQQTNASTLAEASPAALDAQIQAAHLTVQLHQAQQQITDLQSRLADSEKQCETAQTDLADKPKLERDLARMRAIVVAQDQELLTLRGDAALAQTRVAELEAHQLRQHREVAKWQQQCQELQQEGDRQQVRLTELEQQVAELQEQILQQARQGSEYEAAVQYWKDRHLSSRRQIAQLKELLERELPHLPPESDISELLTAVQFALSVDSPDPTPPAVVPSPHFNTLDLPEFIIRRYRYRTRPLHPETKSEQTG